MSARLPLRTGETVQESLYNLNKERAVKRKAQAEQSRRDEVSQLQK